MNNEFLSYYKKELAKIRQLGAEFAKQHPKIADNLQMTRKAHVDG
jgi:type VI secretion system protein ImpG